MVSRRRQSSRKTTNQPSDSHNRAAAFPVTNAAVQCDERQVSSLGIITFILTFPLSPPGKAFSARRIPFQKDNPTCARSSPVREFISHAPEETLLGIQPNSSLKSLLCDPAGLSMGDKNRNPSCQRLGFDQPYPVLKGIS